MRLVSQSVTVPAGGNIFLMHRGIGIVGVADGLCLFGGPFGAAEAASSRAVLVFIAAV